jgi:signal transduction histidine kinase
MRTSARTAGANPLVMRPSKSPDTFLALLASTAARIVQAQDEDGIVRTLVAAVETTPGYDVVRLLLVDDETDALEAEGGLAGWVAHHRKPALTADVRSEVAVPLLLGDTLIGVLAVESKAAGGLAERDMLFLEALAPQIAIAIENARLRRRTLDLQEEERERIARDLHDGMTQTLFGALYQVDTARIRAERSAATSSEPLQRLRTLIVQCVDEMDRIVHDLRPVALDERGLVAALERLVDDIGRHEDEIAIEVQSPIRPLDPRVETAVYRIVQEALTNAVKHSRAGCVRVRLDPLPTHLAVTVSDDGVGFRRVPGRGRGLGLRSMQERASGVGARLDVRSTPGRGTTLSLEVPLEDSDQPRAASPCLA